MIQRAMGRGGLVVLAIVVACLLAHCGGGGGSGSTAPVTQGRVVVAVDWAPLSDVAGDPAASRAVVLTLHDANSDGSDLSWTIPRPADAGACSSQSTAPVLAQSGVWLFEACFTANADGSGGELAVAQGQAAVTRGAGDLPRITNAGTVAKVTVVAGQSLLVAERSWLAFAAVDARLVAVAVPRSQVQWSVVTGGDKLSFVSSGSDKGKAQALAPGAATVRASIGSVASPPETVTVVDGALIGRSGGQMTAAGGALVLTVPSGALKQDTRLTVRPGAGYPADSRVLAGTVFQIEPSGTAFSTPATLTLAYDPSRIPSGAQASSLAIFKVVGSAWQEVTGSTVQVEDHHVSAPLRSLSVYGVLAKASSGGGGGTTGGRTPLVVLGWNDLGMHCMNQDFSELMILPPYNTVHAQVVDRTGEDPRLITSGVTVSYTIPTNTHSADKTNFWQYAGALLGSAPATDVGLSGHRLSGTMVASGNNDWLVTGIPLTPINDSGQDDPYSLATITVATNGQEQARTQAVVPVSWEIRCDLCHNTPGISPATDILRAHDRLHGTQLEAHKPVFCGSCHAQAPLGTTGSPGVPTLSGSMHTAHASRMGQANLSVPCYACHPGVQTKCLRDVHVMRGMTCVDCHTSMQAVGAASRRPWVDEPRCGTPACHQVAGHEYEQTGTLFRDSKGHMGVHCAACHGSPHAVTPCITDRDNLQAIALQGHPGPIDTCTVCHRSQPDDPFPHRLSDGGGRGARKP